LADNS